MAVVGSHQARRLVHSSVRISDTQWGDMAGIHGVVQAGWLLKKKRPQGATGMLVRHRLHCAWCRWPSGRPGKPMKALQAAPRRAANTRGDGSSCQLIHWLTPRTLKWTNKTKSW